MELPCSDHQFYQETPWPWPQNHWPDLGLRPVPHGHRGRRGVSSCPSCVVSTFSISWAQPLIPRGPPRQRAWVPVSDTQNKTSATRGCVAGVQNTSCVTCHHRLGLRVEDRSEQTKTRLCGLDFLTDVHLIFFFWINDHFPDVLKTIEELVLWLLTHVLFLRQVCVKMQILW